MKKLFAFITITYVLFFACSDNNQQENSDCKDCVMSCEDFFRKLQSYCSECECAHLWDYSVKPDTEEWKLKDKYCDGVEIREFSQIPKSILPCMTTEKLTDLCLEYPYRFDVFGWNFLDMGLDAMFTGSPTPKFNVLGELFKRNDASIYLIKRYIETIQHLSSLSENNSIHEIISLQFYSLRWQHALLSRVEQQDFESTDCLKEVLRNLVIGFEAISAIEPDLAIMILEHNYFARAHIIIKICEECVDEIPGGRNNAIFSPHLSDVETAEIINHLSYYLIL